MTRETFGHSYREVPKSPRIASDSATLSRSGAARDGAEFPANEALARAGPPPTLGKSHPGGRGFESP